MLFWMNIFILSIISDRFQKVLAGADFFGESSVKEKIVFWTGTDIALMLHHKQLNSTVMKAKFN